MLINNNNRKMILSMLIVVLLRVFLIIFFGPSDVPVGGDHPIYHSTAMRMAIDSKEWIRPGSEFGYRAPMYFVFLSAIYKIIPEPKYEIGQLLSAILGGINCFLLFYVVKNYFDEKSGWVSFWIRGLLPPFIISDTFVLCEPLFDCFMLITLLIISLKLNINKMFQWLGIGICCALCVLTREAAMFYPLIYLSVLILYSKYYIKSIINVCIFCLFFLITLIPWIFRNEVVWGKLFPLSYTAGVNLHIGNNIKADGRWIIAPSENMPKEIGFGTPEFNNWHMKKGFEFISENPIQFISLGFKKLAWFIFPSFHREDIFIVYGFSNNITNIIAIICGLSSAVLILLGIVSFIFSKSDEYWKILFGFIIYYLVVTFVAYGSARYRDQIDILLIPFMANILIRPKEILFKYYNINNKKFRWRIYVSLGIVVTILLNWIWVLSKK